MLLKRLALVSCFLQMGCAPEPSSFESEQRSQERSDLENRSILWTANHASLDELDFEVALDTRAAIGVFEGRPFDSVDEVDGIPHVGDVALERMAAFGMPVMDAMQQLDSLVTAATPEFLAAFTGVDEANVRAWQRSGVPYTMEEREALKDWIELRATCEPHQVIDADGVVWPDLNSALRLGTDALMLCEGHHVFDRDTRHREVYLNGTGPDSVVEFVVPQGTRSSMQGLSESFDRYVHLGLVELGSLTLTGAPVVTGDATYVRNIEIQNELSFQNYGGSDGFGAWVEDSRVTGSGVMWVAMAVTIDRTHFEGGGHLEIIFDRSMYMNVRECTFTGAEVGIDINWLNTYDALPFDIEIADSTFEGNGTAIQMDMRQRDDSTLEVTNSHFMGNAADLWHDGWYSMIGITMERHYSLREHGILCDYGPRECHLLTE